MGYVYILFSPRLDRYYVGSTNNLERRYSEHARGHVVSTRTGRPWKIIGCIPCPALQDARKLETRIKSWKDRSMVKKLAEMNPSLMIERSGIDRTGQTACPG